MRQANVSTDYTLNGIEKLIRCENSTVNILSLSFRAKS